MSSVERERLVDNMEDGTGSSEERMGLDQVEAAALAKKRTVWIVVVISMVVFSLIMGFALREVNSSSKLPSGWAIATGVIGWMYFSAWSVSFYPQTVQNFVRKSVVGLSFDYQGYNLIGFAAYTAYNCALFFNPTVRAEYVRAHPGSSVPVDANDVFFAIHALLLTIITVVQCMVYERGSQRVSIFASVLIVGSTTAALVYAGLVGAAVVHSSWFDYLLFVSYIKLAVTLVKYVPQAYMNFLRRTTDGFNMENVMLDFTGGSLSVLQLLLESGITGDWSSISGDPVKFGLGLASMIFDVLFLIQHFALYTKNNAIYARARAALNLLEDESDTEELKRHLTLGSVTKDIDSIQVDSPKVRTIIMDAQKTRPQ